MKAIDRLMQYIDYKGINKRSFEMDNELSNGYLATQNKRNADLGEGILNKILNNCLDLSPEWLLTGKGEMLRLGEGTVVLDTGGEKTEFLKKINELQDYKIKSLEEDLARFKEKVILAKENS